MLSVLFHDLLGLFRYATWMDGCQHVVEVKAEAVSLRLKGRHRMSATFTCYQRKWRDSEILPTLCQHHRISQYVGHLYIMLAFFNLIETALMALPREPPEGSTNKVIPPNSGNNALKFASTPPIHAWYDHCWNTRFIQCFSCLLIAGGIFCDCWIEGWYISLYLLQWPQLGWGAPLAQHTKTFQDLACGTVQQRTPLEWFEFPSLHKK